MSSLQIDVGFPIAVLSVAALCIVALRSVESWAERRTRERTERVLAEAARLAAAARLAEADAHDAPHGSPPARPAEPGV
jgi:hypothetical protein